MSIIAGAVLRREFFVTPKLSLANTRNWPKDVLDAHLVNCLYNICIMEVKVGSSASTAHVGTAPMVRIDQNTIELGTTWAQDGHGVGTKQKRLTEVSLY